MVECSKHSSTPFSSFGQAFRDHRQAWAAGVELLRGLCHGMTPISVPQTLSYLCLVRSIVETLRCFGEGDYLDDFVKDLGKWQLLFIESIDFNNTTQTSGLLHMGPNLIFYRDAVVSAWHVDLDEARPENSASRADILLKFQQLAASIVGKSNGLIPCGSMFQYSSGLWKSQRKWLSRQASDVHVTESTSEAEVVPPVADSATPPHIESVRSVVEESSLQENQESPTSGGELGGTLNEKIASDTSTIEPVVALLITGAIIAITIIFLRGLRVLVLLASVSVRSPPVTTIEDRYNLFSAYLGLDSKNGLVFIHTF
ncbi:hypothetical protein BX600DRAFT_474734 [Xylariales sp. PMI_506]|nr:hypothetical protein BX600DRAFT_474734 [Xylariales sp. PMI_506]